MSSRRKFVFPYGLIHPIESVDFEVEPYSNGKSQSLESVRESRTCRWSPLIPYWHTMTVHKHRFGIAFYAPTVQRPRSEPLNWLLPVLIKWKNFFQLSTSFEVWFVCCETFVVEFIYKTLFEKSRCAHAASSATSGKTHVVQVR